MVMEHGLVSMDLPPDCPYGSLQPFDVLHLALLGKLLLDDGPIVPIGQESTLPFHQEFFDEFLDLQQDFGLDHVSIDDVVDGLRLPAIWIKHLVHKEGKQREE